MLIKGENWLFFLHETCKIFSARNAIQWKHQREQGSLGELSWLWRMPPMCWETFRATWGDLSLWLPEISVKAAQLNHCKLFWMSPVYLGRFNRGGNTAAANIWIMLSPSLLHHCLTSCIFFPDIKYHWYQIYQSQLVSALVLREEGMLMHLERREVYLKNCSPLLLLLCLEKLS